MILKEKKEYSSYYIDKVMLKNFKALKGEQWFSLRDITLITGANNSGKSSLIKGLQLISEAFSRSDFPYLDIKNGADELGNWDSMVNYECSDEAIGFGILLKGTENHPLLTLKFEFSYDNYINNYSFSQLELCLDKNEPFLVFFTNEIYGKYIDYFDEDNPGEIRFIFNIERLGDIANQNKEIRQFYEFLKYRFQKYWIGELFPEEVYLSSGWIYKLDFNMVANELINDPYFNLALPDERDLLLFEKENKEQLDAYQIMIEESGYRKFLDSFRDLAKIISMQLKVFSANNMEFVKADKLMHSRIIHNSPDSRFLNNIYQIQLHEGIGKEWKDYYHYNPDNEQSNRFFDYGEYYQQFISKSLNIFKINGFLYIDDIENQGYVIRHITPERSTNLADLGKGTSKIFNIIMKAASLIFDEKRTTPEKDTRPWHYNKILFIEEPEAFLHPNWQASLADFFVFAMKLHNVKFIIETHSEYLVRKLQYLTAKGELKTGQTIIYYLSNPLLAAEDDKFKKEIFIQKTGQLTSEFGPGFYDEATRLMLGLFDDEAMN